MLDGMSDSIQRSMIENLHSREVDRQSPTGLIFAVVTTVVMISVVPVAHHIYGVAHTINCANYVYFRGLQKALTLNHPDVTQVFAGV